MVLLLDCWSVPCLLVRRVISIRERDNLRLSPRIRISSCPSNRIRNMTNTYVVRNYAMYFTTDTHAYAYNV
jgi:hypothetical protein